jgi:Asp-tRNA(Asn)/Glu-tRNA(Gln) amidotransferase A subunit family amidase
MSDGSVSKLEPCFFTAAEASASIRDGSLTSEALVRSCIDRIEMRDPAIKAWLHVDKAGAIAAARERDKYPDKGPLHGIPFGVKDMIDTADMPTTYNSNCYWQHRPAKDAACVAVARHSGAVILGKTDTVEFAAAGRKAATRNPYNLAHTPGGSSSGSGAAVADWQVPLAFGTQTGGSLIRPASFNGIYGLKPTWGVVSREGAKHYSNMLDTIGWYGRSVADLSLVAKAFQIADTERDEAIDVSGLKVAFCKTPFWDKAEAGTHKAFQLAAKRLVKAGALVSDLTLSAPFGGMYEAQTTVMFGEGRASFLSEHLVHGSALHQDFVDRALNSKNITAAQLVAAYDLAAACRKEFDSLFDDIDVVLTPASTGEAPEGLHATGNHIFNAMWTLLHVPCLAIPCTFGDKGLPVGIQVVGPRFSDAKLMRIAAAIAPIIDVERKDAAERAA